MSGYGDKDEMWESTRSVDVSVEMIKKGGNVVSASLVSL